MEIEKGIMNFCPQCGEKIENNVKNCKHCGSLFEGSAKSSANKEYSNVHAEETVSNVKGEYSNVQSINKTALFIIITGGLYQLYWFYRNWRDLKTHKNLDISVGLRTLALFVPLVNLYFIGSQFKDIGNYAEEAGVKTFSIPVVALLWAFCMVMSFRLALYDNPVAIILSWMFILGLVIPFVMVQKTLNEYWIKEQGELPPKGLSGGEILVLVIGVLFALVALAVDALTIFLM